MKEGEPGMDDEAVSLANVGQVGQDTRARLEKFHAPNNAPGCAAAGAVVDPSETAAAALCPTRQLCAAGRTSGQQSAPPERWRSDGGTRMETPTTADVSGRAAHTCCCCCQEIPSTAKPACQSDDDVELASSVARELLFHELP